MALFSDTYLLGVLLIVGYMGIGAVLGVLSERLGPKRVLLLGFITVSIGVLANSWRYLFWPSDHVGILRWVFTSFATYTFAFLALLALPFVAGRYLRRAISGRRRI